MSSSRFSPALQASDLNDFIAPSQDCVISLNKNSAASRLPIKKKEVMVAKPPEESVKISLKDCLACSGCITSAETVMLEKQSLDDFVTRINSGKAVIVSVSPQSRASLTAFFGLSQSQVFRKLTALFKSMGVKAVYDTSSSRDLALIEACNEFVSRYHLNQLSGDKEARSNLPVLSSACPGWICYAEKTLGSYILPYISSVKSPQQVIGAAIKHHMVEKLGLKPSDVYHVTVMPCYDKKLEAVRDDFVFSVEDQEITEVDSVLTTGEVLDLIQSKSIDFKTMEESPLDRLLTNVDEDGHLYGVSGGSGGYAETIFRYAARALFNREIEGSLDFKILRNSDFREVTLEVEGRPVLKFALCYGFRNLQNFVRKIKMGKCEYHYIEVMACPSGCLNGGGQIKPAQGQSPKDLIRQLEGVYMQDVSISSPFDNLPSPTSKPLLRRRRRRSHTTAMGVFTFVCRKSGGEWEAKQHKGELEGSAASTYDLERQLVSAAYAKDPCGGVQSSFTMVSPDSAVCQVIIGAAAAGPAVASAGGAAASGGAAAEAPKAEEKKKEEEKEESEDDLGFSLFD